MNWSCKHYIQILENCDQNISSWCSEMETHLDRLICGIHVDDLPQLCNDAVRIVSSDCSQNFPYISVTLVLLCITFISVALTSKGLKGLKGERVQTNSTPLIPEFTSPLTTAYESQK